MKARKRIYDTLLIEHLAKYRQMVLISGPRQVGKTTTCRNHADSYANWDNVDDRELILAGPARLVERFGLNRLSSTAQTILFDALHSIRGGSSFSRDSSTPMQIGLESSLRAAAAWMSIVEVETA